MENNRKSEYISCLWVTEEIKKLYEESKDKDEFIEKYIRSFASNIKGEESYILNGINDSMLEFRNILQLMMGKCKEVYQEQSNNLIYFWEELEKRRPDFKNETGK